MAGGGGRYLWVVVELVLESLPGALIRVGDGNVVRIWQQLYSIPQQRDPALEERQHSVTEVEALLPKRCAG